MTSPTRRLLEWAGTHGPEVLDALGRAPVVAQQATATSDSAAATPTSPTPSRSRSS